MNDAQVLQVGVARGCKLISDGINNVYYIIALLIDDFLYHLRVNNLQYKIGKFCLKAPQDF